MKVIITNIKSFSAILSLWILIGFSHLMSSYSDMIKQNQEHRLASEDYIYYLFAYMSWAFFNATLYLVLSKIATHQNLYRFVGIYFLGMILWLPLFFVFDAQMGSWAYGLPRPPVFETLIALSNQVIFFYVIVYSLTFGLCAAAVYYQYSKEVRAEALTLETKHAEFQLKLANMQMRELQSQLSPHFLFNCLSSISGLARNSKKDDVINAIARLGDLLRFTLEASKNKLIALSSELEFVENYITLQELRFSNRFTIRIVKEQLNNNLLCPPFLLQTLIENTFSHGVAKSKTLISINVQVKQEDNILRFVIENTGLKKESVSSGLMITMENLRERLSIIFGDRFYLSHGLAGQVYCSRVDIPVVRNFDAY